MAVTKATYTATGTWTAAQLATIFESAFVASGLMTAWHDSFLSGSVENRILAVTYDGGATYGTTYYWFMFSTSGAFVSISATWDTGSHVPTGTQYLDYYSTTTNSTIYHSPLLGLSSTSDASIIRYTSAIDATQSWYAMVQGSSSMVFTIPPASFTVAPWIDMDKTMFSHFLTMYATCPVNAKGGMAGIYSRGCIRRSYPLGAAMDGYTNNYFKDVTHFVSSFTSPGRGSNDLISNMNYLGSTGWSGISNIGSSLLVPTGSSTANPAYSANFAPVFTGAPFSNCISTPNFAADFGIAFHYANNTMVRGDKLIVTASVEEWEILRVSNNPVVTTGASPMFLARVV
jgi:hypothetical protein